MSLWKIRLGAGRVCASSARVWRFGVQVRFRRAVRAALIFLTLFLVRVDDVGHIRRRQPCRTLIFSPYGFIDFFAMDLNAPGCTDAQGNTMQIEVNALRGGSPMVTAGLNQTRDITAKARILKGTAVSGTTIDMSLQIDAVDGLEVLHTRIVSPIRLGVGRGGSGDKLRMNIPHCNSGFIEFVATFYGPDGEGDLCEGTRTIRKTCN